MPTSPAGPDRAAGADSPVSHDRSGTRPATLVRTAVALGVYAFGFGISFGALATTSGLTLAQAMVLSLVLCSGASQFAFIGVLAAGGQAAAAFVASTLLGLRNVAYGPTIARFVHPTGLARIPASLLAIDETAAVVVAAPDDRAARRGFWVTAAALYLSWCSGTFVGGLLGDVVDPVALGLDAAVPVVFFALLWPALTTRSLRLVAAAAAGAAALLVPVAPAGVPVVAAAAVGLVAALVDHVEVPS